AAAGAGDRAELCGGQAPAEAGGGRALQRLLRPAELLLRPAALLHEPGKRRGRLVDVAGADPGSTLRVGVHRRGGRDAGDAGGPGGAGRAVAVTRLDHTGPAVSVYCTSPSLPQGERGAKLSPSPFGGEGLG